MRKDLLREGAGKPGVLIAEDSEDAARLLEFFLRREGFEVVVAPDGMQVVELLETLDPPALVLLDMMLPYVDGMQLIGQIHARSGWEDVPIVMLTALSEEQTVVKALDAGARDYITKPFQPMELMARIRRLLKED